MKVTVKTNYDSIRIYINDVLSVFLKRSELLGFYGLVNGGGKFQIEFCLVGGNLICEYDDFEKFKAILTELDKNITL